LLWSYPRIYFACHRRRVPDPDKKKVLSAHQASILDHLDEVQPTLMGELALHMGVTPGTMSLSVLRLEREGYVARERGETDRRQVLVRLTEDGARIRNAASVLDPDRVRVVLDLLIPEERTRALEGLRLLAGASEDAMRKKAARGGVRSMKSSDIPGEEN